MTMPASDTRRPTAPAASRTQLVADFSFRVTIALLIQYVLGIADNLYGTAPTATKKLGLFSGPLIAAHVVIGTLLIIGAIGLVVVSVRAGSRSAVITSVVGLLSVLVAWGSGSAFAQDAKSGFSMTMGAATAVALLCYLVNVWLFGTRGGRSGVTDAQGR